MTVERIRRLLLGVLILGMSGTFVELVLMSHYEGVYQWAPLVLLGLAIGTVGWHLISAAPRAIRVLRAEMVLLVIASAAGIAFHANGAAAFQLEIDPAMGWRELAGRVLRVHAPPLLAPGVLLQFGLLGLIYTYRHPSITGAERHHQKASTPS